MLPFFNWIGKYRMLASLLTGQLQRNCSKCSSLFHASLRNFHTGVAHKTFTSPKLFTTTNCRQQFKLLRARNAIVDGDNHGSFFRSSAGCRFLSSESVDADPVDSILNLTKKRPTKKRPKPEETKPKKQIQDKYNIFKPKSVLSTAADEGQGRRKKKPRRTKELRFHRRTSYGITKRIVLKKKPRKLLPPLKISKGDREIVVEAKINEFDLSSYHDSDPTTFSCFELRDEVNNGINNLDIHQPTMMQMSAIPRILDGENIFCAAQTGSGKTLAYVAPLVHKLLEQTDAGYVPRLGSPRVVVVAPTKELISQIMSIFRAIGSFAPITTVGLVGSKLGRKKKLGGELDILIGTPDDIIKYWKKGWVSYSGVQSLVLDEADTLVDQGFRAVTSSAMKACKVRERFNESDRMPIQCVLTSATMPSRAVMSLYRQEIPKLEIMQSKVHHLLPHVQQVFVKSTQAEKPALLLNLLNNFLTASKDRRKVMVFCNKGTACHWLCEYLASNDVQYTKLYTGLMPQARAAEFEKFRAGDSRILICTDLASRGIDIAEVMEVINFDCPFNLKDYVHRAGRTGRAQQKYTGTPQVTTFITKNVEVALAMKIQRAASAGEKLSDIRDKEISERQRYEQALRTVVADKLKGNA